MNKEQKMYMLMSSNGKIKYTTSPITVKSISSARPPEVDRKSLPASSFVHKEA